jgi:molecular chaperone GrpE
LSIVDDIERAVAHLPKELADNTWVKGVAGLTKKLENSLDKLGVKRITSKPGTTFDPSLHDAIQMDEDAEGETEVIAEELQAGYTLEGESLRPAMVKVTRK